MIVLLAGATDTSIDVQIVDDTGLPVTGLAAATFPTVKYSKGTGNDATISLSDLSALTDAHTDGGVFERGEGVYRLDLPDAVSSAVCPKVTIRGEATDKRIITPAIQVASATRGLTGTSVPDAAADAAGGLPISDAGGLDLDAKIGALTFTVAGDVDVNVQTWGGTAISTPPAVNATQFSGSATAADNAEVVFATDFATNYNTTNDQWVVSSSAVASVTAGVTLANGAITNASLAGNMEIVFETDFATNYDTTLDRWQVDVDAVGGDTTAAQTLELFAEALDQATGQIDSGTFAASAITASSLATDAVQEIVDATWLEDVSTYLSGAGYNLSRLYLATEGAAGTVDDASATASAFNTSLGQVDDHWNDARLTFVTGSLKGQSKPITDYANTDGRVTFDEPFTAAPANGDSFSVVLDHVHPVSQIADEILDRDASSHTTNSTLGAIINDWEDGGRSDVILDARASQASVDTIDGIVDSILADTGTDGVVVNTFTTAGKAELQTEANDALVAQKLDHLVAVADADDVVDNSIIAKLTSKSATADWSSFVNTTDSLEALRDRGDAAWTTATGFSTHSAADVWSVATRVLTAGTNIQLPSNGLANVTAWTVNITGSLSGSVGSVTGAVGSVTGNVGGNVTGSVGSLATQAKADVNAEVVDVVNVDTLVAGVDIAEALRRIGTITSGEVSGAGTGTETFTDWADSASTIVVVVDSSGNRSSITYN